MHLFIRSVTMRGPGQQVLAHAADMRAYVESKLESGVGLWAVDFGRPLGTMSYTTTVEGLAGYTAMVETFTGDDEYWAKAEGGRDFFEGGSNHLLEPIHGEFGGEAPVGAVAFGTTAVAAAPFADVIAWGVETAQLVEQITEQRVVFGTDIAGSFGEFGFITVSADAAAADASRAKVRASEDYMAMLKAGNDLFVSGASHRTVSTRIA